MNFIGAWNRPNATLSPQDAQAKSIKKANWLQLGCATSLTLFCLAHKYLGTEAWAPSLGLVATLGGTLFFSQAIQHANDGHPYDLFGAIPFGVRV